MFYLNNYKENYTNFYLSVNNINIHNLRMVVMYAIQ